MSKLIALDDGHGMETLGKRTPTMDSGKIIHENEFNRAVVNFLTNELTRCGFNVLQVAPGDSDALLKTRVAAANNAKADAYISIHYNASDGTFAGANPSGNEIHHYPGASDSKRLAELVGGYLKQGTAQAWRGIKASDFYVLRETDMVAVLSENGFMDNEKEAALMVDVNFQKEVAQEHAKGICDYFGMAYVAESAPVVVPVVTAQPVASTPTSFLVKITADVLNVRTGPGVNYPVGTTVKRGEIYTIVETSANWGKLKSGAGWISLDYVTRDTSTPVVSEYPYAGKCTANSVNVRSGAGTGYSVLRHLNAGNLVDVIGKSGDWYHVNIVGLKGYVHKDYITRA